MDVRGMVKPRSVSCMASESVFTTNTRRRAKSAAGRCTALNTGCPASSKPNHSPTAPWWAFSPEMRSEMVWFVFLPISTPISAFACMPPTPRTVPSIATAPVETTVGFTAAPIISEIAATAHDEAAVIEQISSLSRAMGTTHLKSPYASEACRTGRTCRGELEARALAHAVGGMEADLDVRAWVHQLGRHLPPCHGVVQTARCAVEKVADGGRLARLVHLLHAQWRDPDHVLDLLLELRHYVSDCVR
jgi:hypothetical protein